MFTGSRSQETRFPFDVMTRPAKPSIAFDGEWVPGSHCGYNKMSFPGFTEIDSRTSSTRSLTFVRSTAREIMPGYGWSVGAGTGEGSGTGCGPGACCA